MIESIDFYPGNFGVENGRFSGGLIDIRLRRPRNDRFSVDLKPTFLTVVFSEGPLTDNLSIMGARRSYIDFLMGRRWVKLTTSLFRPYPGTMTTS